MQKYSFIDSYPKNLFSLLHISLCGLMPIVPSPPVWCGLETAPPVGEAGEVKFGDELMGNMQVSCTKTRLLQEFVTEQKQHKTA